MTATLGSGEPPAGPWRVEPLHGFIDLLANSKPTPTAGPRIVARDDPAKEKWVMHYVNMIV